MSPPKKRFVAVGQQLGRLTVLDPEVRLIIPHRPKGVRAALCRCSCGNEVTVPLSDLLRAGPRAVRSCGCLRAEVVRELGRSHRGIAISHGLSRHPLYGTWINMLDRCEAASPTCLPPLARVEAAMYPAVYTER